MLLSVLRKFERNQLFSEEEAWVLFRLAAIGEACGWTLLITGIALQRYVLHGNNLPVLIAGQFHGILFLLYALATVGLYPALRWSRIRALVALFASIPPYGSLLFEQWEAYQRHTAQFKTYQCSVVLAALEERP